MPGRLHRPGPLHAGAPRGGLLAVRRRRIINLHHGLLPGFPGAQPYRDAFARHMLTYGATVHFIVPELDAGEQIIHQEAFAVRPGTPLEEVTA